MNIKYINVDFSFCTFWIWDVECFLQYCTYLQSCWLLKAMKTMTRWSNYWKSRIQYCRKKFKSNYIYVRQITKIQNAIIYQKLWRGTYLCLKWNFSCFSASTQKLMIWQIYRQECIATKLQTFQGTRILSSVLFIKLSM